MFLLKYTAQGHGLKEGSWYNLDPKLFDGTRYQSIRSSDSGGAFLRGKLIIRGDLPEHKLSPPRKADLPIVRVPNVGPMDRRSKAIKLSVVNCGHGNWNEVITDKLRLIYDVGASRSYSAAKLRKLVQSRGISAEHRRLVIFISHWDIDHYQALLAFDQADLKKVRAVYAPSQLPDTATFKRVRNVLDQNKIPFRALGPANKLTGQRTITLTEYSRQGPFRVFRATPGRSRNQTGIVIGVEGPEMVALLTGDHHYEKVLAAAQVYYAGKPCVLVTPHHGGHAGCPDADCWLNVFPSLQTPVSCGPNSYGHPYPWVVKELREMQEGKNPWLASMTKAATWDVFL